MSENRKPYVKWTAAEHYRQAVDLLEIVERLGLQIDAAEEPRKATFISDLMDTLTQRAQLHATLACVEPRIRLIAETMTDWGKEDYS